MFKGQFFFNYVKITVYSDAMKKLDSLLYTPNFTTICKIMFVLEVLESN